MGHRQLPPLSAVRTFEAAVRHMSFADAARELCVTASAVSQQIKLLEDYLGVRLFRRDHSRKLSLTAAGHVCAPGLRPMFDSLARLFDQVRAEGERRTVTVLASPSLTATWLAVRLPAFRERHPDIELRLWSNLGLQQAQNPVEHDIAIYFGGGPFEGARVDLMMSDAVFPVCSPHLLACTPIKSAADLTSHCLIHDDTMIWNSDSQALGFPDWSAWLSHAGVTGIDGPPGLRLQMSSAVMAAAIQGVGVALARSCIAEPYLLNGTLVRPLRAEYPRRFAYYLVCNPIALSRGAVAQVHAWLLEQGSMVLQQQSG